MPAVHSGYTRLFRGNLMSSRINFDFDDEFGLSESELETKVNKYIELPKEIYRLKRLPAAEYDKELGKPYLLYSNGVKVYYG